MIDYVSKQERLVEKQPDNKVVFWRWLLTLLFLSLLLQWLPPEIS